VSTRIFPVAGTTTQVFRRQQEQVAQNLYNTSALATGPTIYLDDSPQAPGVLAGIPLPPGSMITWEAGRECYAICATGTAGELRAQPNAGFYFNPYAIAQQINLVGVPIVDKPSIVATGTYVSTGALVALGVWDVSTFQSLMLTVETVEVAGAAPIEYGYGFLLHQPSATALPTDLDAFQHLGDNGVAAGVYERMRLVVPSRGATVTLEHGWSAAGRTVNWTLYGSYRPLDRTKYVNGHGYWQAAGVGVYYGSNGVDGRNIWSPGSVPPLTTYQEWPNTCAGPAHLVFRALGVLPNIFDCFILDYQSSHAIGGDSVPAGFGPGILQWDMELPSDPVTIFIRNRDAGLNSGGVTIALLQDIR